MMRSALIALELASIPLVANSLWTGRINFKDRIVDRVHDPNTYWAEWALIVFAIVTMPLWMLYRERRKG